MAKRKVPEIAERLNHIIQAIDDIFEFTENATYDDFAKDKKTRLAVEKLFEIIGEATYKLPPEFKEKHSGVEWNQMETTRHILVHNYYEVLPEILWNVKEVYLSDLRKKIAKISGSI